MSDAIVTIVGNAKHVKELRESSKGTPYLSFSCAVPYKDRDGETVFNWYNITIFGAQAEALDGKIVDGTSFMVMGSLQAGTYEKEEGGVGLSLQVMAFRFQFTGKKPSEDGDAPAKKAKPDNKKAPAKSKDEETGW